MMWKVEFSNMVTHDAMHTWLVTGDTYLLARGKVKVRLQQLLGTPKVMLGALSNGGHRVYLRGAAVGFVKITKA